MKNRQMLITLLVAATSMFMSCTKETPVAEQYVKSDASSLVTKACVAAPKIVAMVETNDVTPLN